VSVEPFHLFRYLDEQSFRYNQRHDTDRGRFQRVLGSNKWKAADMESPNLSGGGVMAKQQKYKAEEPEKKPTPKKPPGYQNFEKLLKQVVKAPPFRRQKTSPSP
jgi:hypothetical protein